MRSASRAELACSKAGDRVHGHGPPPPGLQIPGLARDLDDLCGVREPEPVDGDGLEGAELDAAVAAVAGAVQHRHAMPGQAGAAVQQHRLIGLDGEQVVRLLGDHQELGSGRVVCDASAVTTVPDQVQVGQQWLEGGTSPGAPSTWRWARTARVVWSIAASRWTWRPSRRVPPGKRGALLLPAPLRTVRATRRGTRLKQAARAIQVRCAGLLSWRARCPRWQAAWTRRVWSPSGEPGPPWCRRVLAAIARRVACSHH